MKKLPSQLYTAAQVRELDRIAIEEFKIPGATLMERAGKATFDLIQKKWPHAKKIAVVCGGGNNAGDGFVVARLLAKAKKDVTVVLAGDEKRIKGDALVAYKKLVSSRATFGRAAIQKHPLDCHGAARLAMTNSLSVLRSTDDGRQTTDLIIDALFGSGLDRPVTGVFKKAIAAMNRSGKPIVAIDVPSGLCADSGSVLGAAVQATATMSFIGLKQGCFTNDGPDCCGKIYFNNLGVPKKLYNHVAPSSLLLHLSPRSTMSTLSTLSTRRKNSHKGLFGHVLVISGAEGMMGAALLTASAALRTGAGLVSLATDKQHVAQIVLKRPEIMAFNWKNAKILNERIEAVTVIAIGPGLGQSAHAKKLLTKVLKTSKPLIVDADALNLLAKRPTRRDNWILTPHPGEAARLLSCSSVQIQKDRFSAIKKIQKNFGGVIVLKGCGSLIFSSSSPITHYPLPITVCPRGTPAMATGGMGDILTGIIAGLVAQGLSLEDAVQLGVFSHARAGEKAAKDGRRAVLAGELIKKTLPHEVWQKNLKRDRLQMHRT